MVAKAVGKAVVVTTMADTVAKAREVKVTGVVTKPHAAPRQLRAHRRQPVRRQHLRRHLARLRALTIWTTTFLSRRYFI